MCDENCQLPGSVPTLNINTSGNATAGPWTIANNNPLRHCVNCGFWYTGYHDCAGVTLTPNAGFAYYPQPASNAEAKTALHRLADELARLTMNMDGDEQAGVWAAYYDLQAALK